MGRDAAVTVRSVSGRDFNPLSPHGERQGNRPYRVRRWEFQSTLPAWGETAHRRRPATVTGHFNPLSPHGERRSSSASVICWSLFQSTLPAWGETRAEPEMRPLTLISIHSPRMGRDLRRGGKAELEPISIHSPRMGRDTIPRYNGELLEISIHSPRMGRDFHAPFWGYLPTISIHSPRMGRDSCWARKPAQWRNFNPLSPHGERRSSPVSVICWSLFQSTLPAWGETKLVGGGESDEEYFNPLSPHGERLDSGKFFWYNI